MALLINKPKRVVINTTATLTLNRAELAGYFAGNSYFSNTANWDKVYFYYTDASGKQSINVIFNANSNTAPFKPSSSAKQSRWTLNKIIVRDYDRGLITLNRSQYFSALSECDMVIAVPNRTPSAIFLSNTSPLENQTFVGNLTATDPDIEDPLVYSVVAGFGDAADFKIVGNNALHFVTAPNFEVKNQYSVKIRVTDSSDAFYEQAFTINVVDANDAPSNITLTSNTIYENLSVNSVIGTLFVTDEDAGNSHTLSIVGGDVASFNLNGNQLRSSEVFNYEAKASYSVVIRAVDNAGASYEKTLNISVLNANEAPTGITLSNNAVNEYSPTNTVVGVLTTTDVDGGDTFTYSIVGGDTSSFNINGNQLRTSQVFDFETKSSYSVTVSSVDAGGLSVQNTFTININNISEAPTNIFLSGSSINENAAANTVIGTLTASTPTAQAVTYSLVGGDVASFNINGNQLRSSASFDFESKSSYSVTIRGSTGGESFDKTFSISVNNVPEPPSNVLLSANSISENNAVNAVIGTLSAVGDTCTYTIIGGDTSAFNINGNELRASIAFNREAKSSYSVTIRATTPFNQTLDKTFSIFILDVDEFMPTSVVQWGGSIGGYAIRRWVDAQDWETLFYVGVRDADWADSPNYDVQGINGEHYIQHVEGRVYWKAGSGYGGYRDLRLYETFLWPYYWTTNGAYKYRIARNDNVNNINSYEYRVYGSYVWIKVRIYKNKAVGFPTASDPYTEAIFTFNIGE